MEKIRVSALKWAPPMVHGLVRDLRVRWALEEAAIPYEERLWSGDDIETEAYLKMAPFGLIPAIEDGDLAMFESGAILLYLAEKSSKLHPSKPREKAWMYSWMFAALNSVEPWIMQLAQIDFFNADKAWAKERRPEVEEMAIERLEAVENSLKGHEYLAGPFTVADILMGHVLRISRSLKKDIVADLPGLKAYRDRCEARPAFQRALQSQLETFAKHAPPSSTQ